MILLGIILIVVGLLVPRLHLLWTIGAVVLVVGVIFWAVSPHYAYY